MKLVVLPWLPSVQKGVTTYAITIAPFVFILPEWKNDPGILAHEQVHLDQVKEMGWWNFYRRYITDTNFRSTVEAAGYAKRREVDNV